MREAVAPLCNCLIHTAYVGAGAGAGNAAGNGGGIARAGGGGGPPAGTTPYSVLDTHTVPS